VENRILNANERREELLSVKQTAVKIAEEKHQVMKVKLATKLKEDKEALEKRIEAMEARANKNRTDYLEKTTQELREKNKQKNKRELTKVQEEQQREETRQRMLLKQAEAEARAQEARDKVQGKASRMVLSAQEKLAALKLAEEASAAFTKELNCQRHADAEARKVAALQETMAKGTRLGSPVKLRVELAEKDKAERVRLRLSMEKRLAEAEARAEALREETSRKAASMASPRRVKLSSARQADASPIATQETTVEFPTGTEVVFGVEVAAQQEAAAPGTGGHGSSCVVVDAPIVPGSIASQAPPPAPTTVEETAGAGRAAEDAEEAETHDEEQEGSGNKEGELASGTGVVPGATCTTQ